MNKLITYFIFYLLSIHYASGQEAVNVDSLANVLSLHNNDTNRVNALISIAYFYRNSNPDLAKRNCVEARQLSYTLSFNKGIIVSYNIEGIVNIKQGDYHLGIVNMEACIEACKVANEMEYPGSIFNNLGLLYDAIGEYQKAITNYKCAQLVFDDLEAKGDTTMRLKLANLYNNIGVVYFNKSNYDSALFYYNTTLAMDNIYDEELIGMTHCNIGFVEEAKGRYSNAIKHLYRYIETTQRTENDIDRSSTLNYIGDILTKQGLYEQALQVITESYQISIAIGDKPGVAGTYASISQLYQAQHQLDSAERYIRLSLAITREIDDSRQVASRLLALGDILYDLNKLNEAINALSESKDLFTSIEDVGGASIAGIEIGKIFIKQEKYNRALILLEKGIESAIELGNRDAEMSALEQIALCHYKMEQPTLALKYLKQFQDIKDSLNNDALSEQLARFQSQYETEKKEQEIILLTKNIEIEERKEIGYFGGLALLLSVLILFTRQWFLKKKTNRYLTEVGLNIKGKNELIVHANTQINSSIAAAKKIHAAIIPSVQSLNQLFKDHFVYFKPKDVVGGDFYWVYEDMSAESIHFSTVDCTGHGVPGAFMSLIASNLLDNIVTHQKITKPNEVLDNLSIGIQNRLRQEEGNINDGMDLTFCTFKKRSKKLTFASAYNALYHIRKGVLTEYKGERIMIGKTYAQPLRYALKEIIIESGDIIYLSSDGYVDQKGGPKNKKFFPMGFRELLKSIHALPMAEQKNQIEKIMNSWMADNQQIDDLMILGIAF